MMADGDREKLLEEFGRASERVAELERAQAAEAVRITELESQIPDTPSIGAFNFLGVSQVEEANFFTNLTKAKVGERRDKIVMNGKNVADKMNALDEKWRYLFDQDNSLDEYQRKIVEQVGELIDRAFDDSDRERRTIKERLVGSTQAIAKLTKKYGRPIRELLQNLPSDELKILASAIEAIEKLEPSIDAYAKIYLKVNSDYVARAAEYAALLQSEKGGIYVLFAGFRRDTEEFLKTHGFDVAKVDHQAASDALASWSSSSATSGQRSDAEYFAKDLLGKLSNHLSVTERTFSSSLTIKASSSVRSPRISSRRSPRRGYGRTGTG
ncbi:hypothetical protein BH09MYX1_BH09MYX1_65390 [soil metagenome]